MLRKLVLLLALATVVVQCYVPYDAKEPATVHNEDHRKTAHEMTNMIEDALKGAESALFKLHHDAAYEVKQITDTAQTKYSRQFNHLLGEIKKMKEEADKLKADVTECLKGHEDELENLNKEVHKEVEACGQLAITKSRTLVEGQKKKMEVSLTLFDKLIAQFDACAESAEVEKCEAKVSDEFTQAFREAIDKVAEVFNTVMPITKDSGSMANKCVLKKSRPLVMAELKTTKVILTCIKNKIHPIKEA